MVRVAQLVESRIVIPVVVGSSPISYPTKPLNNLQIFYRQSNFCFSYCFSNLTGFGIVPNLVVKNASQDLQGTNLRAQYRDWANRLKYLCTGGHREDQARAEASRILWKFKTRPALVDEMNKAGFQSN